MFNRLIALFNKNVKFYGHVISLGYNCEISFQFFLKYHFVESSLFAWVACPSIEQMIYALLHVQEVGAGKLEPQGVMWRCFNTDILFHGKAPMSMWLNHPTPQQIAEDKAELVDRLKYLRAKFQKTACDGKKNLYIFKYPKTDETAQTALEKINRLEQTLRQIVSNPFDLLIVLQEGLLPGLEALSKKENIFIRRVAFYAPDDNVTTELNDRLHWGKIFDEFRPAFKLKKKKHFKFEDR